MRAESHLLQDFDLVVQSFAEAVGTAVLPGVLDVAPSMTDSAGGRVELLHFGGGILFDLFCQLPVLDGVGIGSKNIMEELEGVHRLPENPKPQQRHSGGAACFR